MLSRHELVFWCDLKTLAHSLSYTHSWFQLHGNKFEEKRPQHLARQTDRRAQGLAVRGINDETGYFNKLNKKIEK
jgi:hypothetical protein